jgi:Flp pilus assembly protein TadD
MLMAAVGTALPGCRTARPHQGLDGAAPEQTSDRAVPKLPAPALGEHSVAAESAPLGAAPPAAPAGPSDTPDVPEPAAPPAPDTVLAAISEETPPQQAASLRLSDEGRRLLAAGDVAGALDRLETAIRIDPANGHAYYWLAQVHYRRERFDQAVAFAEKAGLLLSRTDQAWASQAYVFKGTVYEQLGRYGDARAAYRQALDMEGGNVAARAGLSRLEMGSGGD